MGFEPMWYLYIGFADRYLRPLSQRVSKYILFGFHYQTRSLKVLNQPVILTEVNIAVIETFWL